MSDLRTQLEAIRNRQGTLTPDAVLSEARNPEHPLHGRFEWDDEVAGENWRRHQAHELIVSVKITYADDQDEPKHVRAYHAIRRESGYSYEPAEEIARDEMTTKILKAEMKREWQALQRRYGHFEEFVEMVRRDLGEDAA